MKRILLVTSTVMAVAMASLGGYAYATGAQINGCVLPDGLLRIVGSADDCRNGETPLSWAAEPTGGDQAYMGHFPIVSDAASYYNCETEGWQHYRCGYEPGNPDYAYSYSGAHIPDGATVEVEYVLGAAAGEYICARVYNLTLDAPVDGTEHCYQDPNPDPSYDDPGSDEARTYEKVRIGPIILPNEMHDYTLQTKGAGWTESSNPYFPDTNPGFVERAQFIITKTGS